ncbi:MAG: GNAT family acetyltransferase [Herminiimonas sp.]|nr:GNAT family acetyltransferase [Herminiimonas sp.]
MIFTQFEAKDASQVVALWHACGLTRSWNDPMRDIARKQLVQPELFLVLREGETIAATIMAGFDGHRGWVNYLAVAETHRGRGIGRALMAEVEQRLERAGCPKLNLLVRADNYAVLDFYTHLGYVADDAVALGKRLIHDVAPKPGPG